MTNPTDWAAVGVVQVDKSSLLPVFTAVYATTIGFLHILTGGFQFFLDDSSLLFQELWILSFSSALGWEYIAWVPQQYDDLSLSSTDQLGALASFLVILPPVLIPTVLYNLTKYLTIDQGLGRRITLTSIRTADLARVEPIGSVGAMRLADGLAVAVLLGEMYALPSLRGVTTLHPFLLLLANALCGALLLASVTCAWYAERHGKVSMDRQGWQSKAIMKEIEYINAELDRRSRGNGPASIPAQTREGTN